MNFPYSAIMQEALSLASGKIKDVIKGEKVIAVETEAGTGLAFVTEPLQEPSKISGIRTEELILNYAEGDLTLTAYALAAINSYLSAKGRPDTQSWAQKFEGAKKLAMVGAFHPIVEEMKSIGTEVIIFELNGAIGTHKPEEAAELMPDCDAVLITGATFSNRSIHGYLPHIAPTANAHITGPSTPLADALLSRFTLGTSIVRDKEAVSYGILSGKCINGISKHLDKVILTA